MFARKWLYGLVAACWSAAVCQPALSAEKPLLSAGSLTPTPKPTYVKLSRGLTRVVLAALDKTDIGVLDDCLAGKGLKKADYAALLIAARVEAGKGRSQWFVRPVLEPYCGSLYGAHLFRYFWIEEVRSGGPSKYRLLFKNGGDAFAVYPTRHHGLNDIQATGCVAFGCRVARMAFDGRRYRPTACSTISAESEGDGTKRRRCGSDDWRDDQASGFNPAGL